jgi:hypothetical protein
MLDHEDPDEARDVVITQEMKTFFETGIVPPGFLFESVQREFAKSTSKMVNSMNATDSDQKKTNSSDIVDVEEGQETLKVDTKDNLVGYLFKVMLARRVCYVMDCLYYFLKMDVHGEMGVVEKKFGETNEDLVKSPEFYTNNEKTFFELTQKIFSVVSNEEEATGVVQDLVFKLDLLYRNFKELKVLWNNSSPSSVFGLNDESVCQEYVEYKAEIENNTNFLDQIGMVNVTCSHHVNDTTKVQLTIRQDPL